MQRSRATAVDSNANKEEIAASADTVREVSADLRGKAASLMEM